MGEDSVLPTELALPWLCSKGTAAVPGQVLMALHLSTPMPVTTNLEVRTCIALLEPLEMYMHMQQQNICILVGKYLQIVKFVISEMKKM